MRTYTICGSMRFAREMRDIAYMLETQRGVNALQCAYAPNGAQPDEHERQLLAGAHYRKIDLSDGIYVVNIGGYIGEAVSREIAYARAHGKEVLFHCEEGSY